MKSLTSTHVILGDGCQMEGKNSKVRVTLYVVTFEGNFGHAQKIKHNINKKYVAENKQTTLKIPLGSTCSVTNHDNEMKFQP